MIPDYLFYNCSSIAELTIPNSVTSIGAYAFYGCSSIAELTISNSVTSIEDYTFYHCSSIAELTIPNSVTSIGDYAFDGCSGVVELTIPNSVTSIGTSAFEGCSGVVELTIPNSVTSIEEYTFYGCSSIAELTIPNSVTSIGNYAFGNCSGLPELTLPEQLESIGSGAFYGCTGLSEVSLPMSVIQISGMAFYLCKDLIVTSPNPEPPTCAYGAFRHSYDDGILYVPLGKVQIYAKADGWSEFKHIVALDLIAPTVTTLEARDITHNTAVLYGSATIGNEDILHVGFEYWTDGGTITSKNVDSDGDMFSLTLNRLDYETKYYYRAYAETESGTFYGDEMSFTTDDIEGIDGIAADGAEIVEYYSTDGQRITSPTKGVNIVRLSDGTTKKVLVK